MKVLKVDCFQTKKINFSEDIYLLTHAHTDHGVIPKHFPCAIHCSTKTKMLISANFPNVHFLEDLRINNWCLLNKTVFIYCFCSNHCFGGIGFYCPQLSLLHFGDGRPKPSTISMITHMITLFPPQKGQLKTVCDTFFLNDPKFNPVMLQQKIPTIQESHNILYDTIQTFHASNSAIHIRIAHFGVLSCLPRLFGYHFISSKTTYGSRLCQTAFYLMKFLPGPITISQAQDKNIELQDNAKIILLSAQWWLLQTTTMPLLNLFKSHFDATCNATRIFVCSHASPGELTLNFHGLCKQ